MEALSFDTKIDDIVAKFRDLTVELSKLAKTEGINIEAYNANGIKRYASLPKEVQHGIYANLQCYLDLCLSAIANGVSLKDENRSFTWWALRRFGLRPPSDLFSYLENDHFIEIYNTDSIQIFRSFGMLRFLSYSLSEIFSFEWFELFKRDESANRDMHDVTTKIFSGQIREVVVSNFDFHKVEEIFSNNKNRALVQHAIFSPMYDEHGVVTAMLCALKAKGLAPRTESNNEEN